MTSLLSVPLRLTVLLLAMLTAAPARAEPGYPLTMTERYVPLVVLDLASAVILGFHVVAYRHLLAEPGPWSDRVPGRAFPIVLASGVFAASNLVVGVAALGQDTSGRQAWAMTSVLLGGAGVLWSLLDVYLMALPHSPGPHVIEVGMAGLTVRF
jgi:hypothetical protein